MITILISRAKLRTGTAVLVVLLTLSGCTGPSQGDGRVSVVATTSIWGDVARQIVGADGTVDVLVPIGVDAHDYQPSPRQIADLQAADLVIANGLGLEEGLTDVLSAAEADGANLYEVAPNVDPIPFPDSHDEEHEDEDETGEENEHGDLDPHVWFDPTRVAAAARSIADQLADVDPSLDWASRAEAYVSELEAADGEIEAMTAAIPQEDRKLVTNHESLGYFANRYGFEIVGVVIPGGSTLADPSSAELAELVAEIEHEGVDVIFAETTQPSRLAEAVAEEVGTKMEVIELYTESLGGPGSDAATLIEMLLTDAGRIATGLG